MSTPSDDFHTCKENETLTGLSEIIDEYHTVMEHEAGDQEESKEHDSRQGISVDLFEISDHFNSLDKTVKRVLPYLRPEKKSSKEVGGVNRNVESSEQLGWVMGGERGRDQDDSSLESECSNDSDISPLV